MRGEDFFDTFNIINNKIDNFIFGIDSLDNNFPYDFPKLFSSIKTTIRENIKNCKLLAGSIESYDKLNQKELNKGELNKKCETPESSILTNDKNIYTIILKVIINN